MNQVVVEPPPLPPKSRRTPPDKSTTVSVLKESKQESNGLEYGIQIPHSHFSISPASSDSHVVKIVINPQNQNGLIGGESNNKAKQSTVVSETRGSCVRVCVNVDSDMIQKTDDYPKNDSNKPFFLYGPYSYNGTMTSGQISPSDTLDSGTCSDLDGTPPPLPRKNNKNAVSITLINNQHKRGSSIGSSEVDGDSDDNDNDNDSNVSYDSLNSGEIQTEITSAKNPQLVKNAEEQEEEEEEEEEEEKSLFPLNLLQDIRHRTLKLTQIDAKHPSKLLIKENSDEIICNGRQVDLEKLNFENGTVESKGNVTLVIDESTYEERKQQERHQEMVKALNELTFDTDKLMKFHLNEHHEENEQDDKQLRKNCNRDDETFAGYKDLFGIEDISTIRSAKGTVRGVKNRVRAGIQTFLQIGNSTRTYKEKDANKVVVYTTTMGIVRETYHNCMKVKKILRTLLVKFEERDVFMSNDYQNEIRERMRCENVLVPQVFVDGQHIGDADNIETLNETGELRKIMKPYKSMDACTPCKMCGGYRLLPCTICNGSKKSVHRNHFTTEFVALKCMNCDEVGLVKCSSC